MDLFVGQWTVANPSAVIYSTGSITISIDILSVGVKNVTEPFTMIDNIIKGSLIRIDGVTSFLTPVPTMFPHLSILNSQFSSQSKF